MNKEHLSLKEITQFSLVYNPMPTTNIYKNLYIWWNFTIDTGMWRYLWFWRNEFTLTQWDQIVTLEKIHLITLDLLNLGNYGKMWNTCLCIEMTIAEVHCRLQLALQLQESIARPMIITDLSICLGNLLIRT